MKINSSFLYNNFYTPHQSISAFSPVNFGRKQAEDVDMKIKLSDFQMRKVQQLADTYEQARSSLNRYNGPYQKKIKSAFPEMITVENIKGFLFNSLASIQNEVLQVIKTNPRKTSQELLSFNVLDSKNEPLMQFKVDKNGILTVKRDENISKQQLDDALDEKNIKYIDKMIKSLKKVDFYAQNYYTLSKQARILGHQDVSDTISQINEVKNSKGLKPEIEQIKSLSEEISELLYSHSHRDAFTLRREFFGDLMTQKTKGLIFKSNAFEKKTIAFYPFQKQTDNRAFRITILNDKNEKENSFVFFDDGRIAKQREGLAFDKDYRQNKLYTIPDSEIEKYQIRKILSITQNKLSNFVDFVNEKRQQKKHRKAAGEISETLSLKAKEISKKKEREINRKQQAALKKAQKEERQKILAEKKQAKEIKQKELQAKRALREAKRNKNQHRLPKDLRVKNILKTQNKKPELSATAPEVNNIQKAFYFDSMILYDICEKLTKIFDTPVEQRSSHLVHERLSNGNIFGGRFSFTATDGAKITVSRVKSPRYVEFVYYSIKVVTKDGEEFILNIDPVEDGRILENTSEGRPFIDKKRNVHHTSKEKFLAQNPAAINLPLYFSELFAVRDDVERKTVKFKKADTAHAQLLAKKEQDVIKALHSEIDDEKFDN